MLSGGDKVRTGDGDRTTGLMADPGSVCMSCPVMLTASQLGQNPHVVWLRCWCRGAGGDTAKTVACPAGLLSLS